MTKIKICSILCIVVLFCLALCCLFSSQTNLYQIDFLDVGQGDAILIQTPSQYQVLIDGGPDDAILDQLRRAMPLGDTSIDLLILSHADADHLTGLVEVIQEFEIKQAFMPRFSKSTKLYSAWVDILSEKEIPVTYIESEIIISLDKQLSLHFLHPTPETVFQKISANDKSIVFIASIDEVDLLFTGDIESEVESKLVEYYQELDVEILKSPHHGSKSSSTIEFLNATHSEIVVIQVGKENKFGHPHQRVLHRYNQLNSTILRTDLLGRIQLLTDGNSIYQKEGIWQSFPHRFGVGLKTLYTVSN